MKEKKNLINLDQYLSLIGIGSLVAGLSLFGYCTLYDISVLRVQTMSNPLFYLILGLGLLSSSFFFKVDEVIAG
jgi:hypothetical protein